MKRIYSTQIEPPMSWLGRSLYWLLWGMVIMLLYLSPSEEGALPQPSPLALKPQQTTPIVQKAPPPAPVKQATPLTYNLTPKAKLKSATKKTNTSLPPTVMDNLKLPVTTPARRAGIYPDSNERGQIRLDAKLHKPGAFRIETDPLGHAHPVSLRLMGPVQGLWLQAEGEPAVGDLDGLIAKLTQDTKTDREKAEKLFDFVVHQMKDWYYPAQGFDLTVEDLKVLIWNFGYGFCYDLGRLQAGLWAQAGLRSRIVGWPQHTVAEVFYDGAWHLYDLQHRSYYEKPDGQVASFAELKANPDLFYQGLNAFGLDAIGYPPHHMSHWYGIADPKFEDSQDGPHWKMEKDFRIDLRFGETLDILYTQPGAKYHPDSWHQYYGEKTLRKDPPWPLTGRLTYAPDFLKAEAQWDRVTTPHGKPGFAITMQSPFIFTEAWMKIPQMKGFSRFWIHVWDQTLFGGRLVGGNAIFSKHIAGSNAFTIIVEPEGDGSEPQDFGLERAQVHTRFNLSPIGLPKLKPGINHWPINFESGSPHISLWYLERSPELKIQAITSDAQHPRPGDQVMVHVEVKNLGSRKNRPTSLTLFNNVTAFLSETIEKVGVQTIPPLAPGESTTIAFPWIANTRNTWYGQNPHVQLFDAWIDMEGDHPDPKRENNRLQQYFLLAKEDGQLPEMPGYQPLH